MYTLPLLFDALPTPWSMGRFTLLLFAFFSSSSTNSSSLSSFCFRLLLSWTFLYLTLSSQLPRLRDRPHSPHRPCLRHRLRFTTFSHPHRSPRRLTRPQRLHRRLGGAWRRRDSDGGRSLRLCHHVDDLAASLGDDKGFGGCVSRGVLRGLSRYQTC